MANVDAQYVIDIAANMPDGEATLTQLDELTKELTGAGKQSDIFQQAMKQASDALALTKEASAASSAALAEGTAEFDRLERAVVRTAKAHEVATQKHELASNAASSAAQAVAAFSPQLDTLSLAAKEAAQALELAGGKDRELAMAANEAASALAVAEREHGRLAKQAERMAAAEARAAERMAVTGAAANDAKGALESYTPTLKGLESAAKEASSAHDKQAKALANVTKLSQHTDKSFGQNKASLAALKGALDQSGGSLGRVAGKVVDLRAKYTALTEHIGASRAAMVMGTAALAAASIALGAVTLGAVAVGAAMLAMGVKFADTARDAQLSRDAFAALSPETKAATEAFGLVRDATGLADDRLMGLTKSLKDARVRAADMPAALLALAKAEKALGQGGAAEFVEQLRNGRTSVDRLSRDVESKFGGIVSKRMMSLGDQGERLSRNLRGLFGGLDIDPLLRGLDRVVNMFSETHEIGRAIKMTFEGVFGPLIKGSEDAAVTLERWVLKGAIFLTESYISFKKFHNNLKATWDSIGRDIDAALTAVEDFVGKRMYGIGRDMINGAIRGIAGMAGPLTGALVSAFQMAGKGVDKSLDRHSPSKEYERRAVDMMRGAEQGVDKRAPRLANALESAFDPGALSLPSGDGLASRMMAQSDGAGAAPSVDLSGAQFIFQGVEGAEQAVERFEEVITRVLRGDAARLAGATAGGAL